MELERRHSDGRGLLFADGASRANILSGDAPHSLLTMSTVLDRDRPGRIGQDYFAYFANPYNVTRTMRARRSREIVQRAARAPPSSGASTSSRASTAASSTRSCARGRRSIQRDLQVEAVIADIYAGRPVTYTTFLAYDEVAHHSGIERPETLADAAPRRPPDRAGSPRRPPTRRARTGSSSSPTTASRRARRSSTATASRSRSSCATRPGDADAVASPEPADEALGYLGAGAHRGGRGRDSARPRARARRDRSAGAVDGAVRLGRGEGTAAPERRGAARDRRDGVRLPRALISFPREPGRVTLERLAGALPRRRPDPARPPRHRLPARALRGARRGRHRAARHDYLDEDRVEGEDPLAPFGPNAARARQAHRRLRALPGHRHQQHLLGRARRGRRVRGARRLARRDGRGAVVPVRPAPGRPRAARGGAHRRRGRAPPVPALARAARPRPSTARSRPRRDDGSRAARAAAGTEGRGRRLGPDGRRRRSRSSSGSCSSTSRGTRCCRSRCRLVFVLGLDPPVERARAPRLGSGQGRDRW